MALTNAQATLTSGIIQGGTSLFGNILGGIVSGVQARRAEKKADEWNNKILEREDQQNRFSNLMTMRQSEQAQEQIDESKKMNSASLYQSQFNNMLSTINNNANLKNLVLQRWGGK